MTGAVPLSWLPQVPMKRVIGHWTAGSHTANATDKKAYHILVEGDGSYVRGTPSISANSGGLSAGYAAHTLNCNTDSIGVSMCAMAGAKESPFDPGRYPVTEAQWDAFVRLLAQIVTRYSIPVTNKTVLTHAEVQSNLGITQRAKWDVSRLPHRPDLIGARAIGDLMRSQVIAATSVAQAPAEPLPSGARAQVVAAAKTSSVKNGPVSGSLPVGVIVEVLGASDGRTQVRTPGGYIVWVDSHALKIVDGPDVESGATPSAAREAISRIRAELDALESLL